MPKRTFKGLPTVKKFVARITKTGKLSTYYQRYHKNPFKRDKVSSDARKGKSVISDNELANDYGKALKFGVKSDKGLTFKDWSSTLRVSNGTIGGVHTVNKINDKIKNVDDAKTFVSDVFKPITKQFNDKNISNNITLVKEMGMLFNNTDAKSEMYNTYISGIKDTADNMHDTATGTMLASFTDFNMVNDTINTSAKSEAYTFDTMNHDFNILSKNPIYHIMNYCQFDIFENIKHLSDSMLNVKNNNLKYLQNNSTLDKMTYDLFDIYIEKLNKDINNKKLYLYGFIELNVDVAVLMYKKKINLNIPFTFSPILELYDEKYELLDDNFKIIKDIQVDNMLPIDMIESKIVMDKDSKTIFLYIKWVTDNKNKKFMYIPDMEKINDISKYIVDTVKSNKLSESYLNEKNSQILSNLEDNIKNNKYLVFNWMS